MLCLVDVKTVAVTINFESQHDRKKLQVLHIPMLRDVIAQPRTPATYDNYRTQGNADQFQLSGVRIYPA